MATKIPPLPGDWSPSPYCKADERYPEDYLRKITDECRKNLGVDTIDLMQLHSWTRAWLILFFFLLPNKDKEAPGYPRIHPAPGQEDCIIHPDHWM